MNCNGFSGVCRVCCSVFSLWLKFCKSYVLFPALHFSFIPPFRVPFGLRHCELNFRFSNITISAYLCVSHNSEYLQFRCGKCDRKSSIFCYLCFGRSFCSSIFPSFSVVSVFVVDSTFCRPDGRISIWTSTTASRKLLCGMHNSNKRTTEKNLFSIRYLAIRYDMLCYDTDTDTIRRHDKLVEIVCRRLDVVTFLLYFS